MDSALIGRRKVKPDRLRVTSFVVALIGLVDSVYLSWIKVAQKEAFCSNIGDCDTVNTSIYSEIGGIPIALLGVGAYLAILALLFLEKRAGFWQESGVLILFGLTLAGVLYSSYLTYVEIAILRAICPYCVLSALALLVLLVITVVRLIKAQSEEIFQGG